MRSVGAVEAKIRFGALLDAVARGEEVEITRHGRAVARLVPVAAQATAAAEAAAARIIKRSRGVTLGGISIKELHVLRRAPEPHHADANAAIYEVDERAYQEGGQLHSRGCTACHSTISFAFTRR